VYDGALVEVLHRTIEVLYRTIEVLYRAIEVLHRTIEALHRYIARCADTRREMNRWRPIISRGRAWNTYR